VLFAGNDWAEDHHDEGIVDEQGCGWLVDVDTVALSSEDPPAGSLPVRRMRLARRHCCVEGLWCTEDCPVTSSASLSAFAGFPFPREVISGGNRNPANADGQGDTTPERRCP
jgi:hypothetical protein